MNTENNKIIAEFMGLSYSEKYQFEGWYKNHEHNERVYELLYDTDWNWLMEVVEKIDYLERNTEKEEFIQKISTVTSLPLFTPKHTLYNACVEFINWYNKQKS